jgi:hypothetical protein
MKPRKIDKFTPAPPGYKKVHIDYYMAYPKVGPTKKAPAAKKKAAPKALSKNVTVRKKTPKKNSFNFAVPSTGKKVTF